MLSALRDAADAQGRDAPSIAERRAAALHGLASRLDRPAAFIASAASLMLAAFTSLVSLTPLAFAEPWFPLARTLAVPALAALAIIALLRVGGALSDRRALALVPLSALALALGVLASLSWSLGFDAADAGMQATGLGALFMPLAAAAWGVAALTVAVSVEPALRRGIRHPFASVTLACLSGLLAAPIIGWCMLMPAVPVVIGTALLIVSARVPVAVRPAPPLPAPVRTATHPRLTRALALIALVVGGAGIVYMFTGTMLPSFAAADGTAAVGTGIRVQALAALPLLAALAVRTATHAASSARAHWAPFIALAGAALATFTAYHRAPDFSGMLPGLAVSSALTGLAISWWAATRLRASTARPRLVAALIGAGYAASIGVFAAVLLVFSVVPLALWLTLSTRPAGRPALAGPNGSASARRSPVAD